MQATQIHEHARKLFDARGAKAIVEAAQTAARLERQGAKGEARDWRRIEQALRHLKGPHES